MRITVELPDVTDKEADDLAMVIVDYLIGVEQTAVSGYWVED